MQASSGTYSCARCHTHGWSYDQPLIVGRRRDGTEPHRRLRGAAVPEREPITSSSSPTAPRTASATARRGRARAACPASARCTPRSRSRPWSSTSGGCDGRTALTLAFGWEPEIRGIVVVLIAVGVLMGSVYLILVTNLGVAARPARGARRAVRLDDDPRLDVVGLRHRLEGRGPDLGAGRGDRRRRRDRERRDRPRPRRTGSCSRPTIPAAARRSRRPTRSWCKRSAGVRQPDRLRRDQRLRRPAAAPLPTGSSSSSTTRTTPSCRCSRSCRRSASRASHRPHPSGRRRPTGRVRADDPRPRVQAATRGAHHARIARDLPRLAAMLHSRDKESMRRHGISLEKT